MTTTQLSHKGVDDPEVAKLRLPAIRDALRRHWPEYIIEAAGLGLFMMSACLFGLLLEHPASPARGALPSPAPRRALMGLAMAATAIAIIYSRWGKRSGAHLNPSVTLTFFRLGKVQPWDALCYVVSQFAGGVAGVLVAAVIAGRALADPAVNYVVTAPGPLGAAAAFLTELGISFLLMLVVLFASNAERLARYTGIFAGVVVALNIAVTAPLSGMSMNPARTFASAVFADVWTAIWIYFTAPPLGMLLAAQLYLTVRGARRVFCAKLHHDSTERCIFCEERRRGVQ